MDSGARGGKAMVIVTKRKVFPLNSAACVQCKQDRQLSEYVVQPQMNLKVEISGTVHEEGNTITECIVTDKFITIKKGKLIASAQKVTWHKTVKIDIDSNVSNLLVTLEEVIIEECYYSLYT